MCSLGYVLLLTLGDTEVLKGHRCVHVCVCVCVRECTHTHIHLCVSVPNE